MRSLLPAVVVLVAFACSKGGDSAPKLTDDKPAGTVLEAQGKVVAKRDRVDDPRLLNKGDDVFPDDSIITDVGASVQIKLHHNQAVLSLGQRKVRKLFGSLAWKAKKGQKVDDVATNDRIMVAGRHAERQAGETTPTRRKLVDTDDKKRAPDKNTAPKRGEDEKDPTRKPGNKQDKKQDNATKSPVRKRPKTDKSGPTKDGKSLDEGKMGTITANDRVRVRVNPRSKSSGATTGAAVAGPIRKVVVRCMKQLHTRYPKAQGVLVVTAKPRARPRVTVKPRSPGMNKLAACVGNYGRWPGMLRALLKDNGYTVMFTIRPR